MFLIFNVIIYFHEGYGHCGPWKAGIRLNLQRTAACDDAKQGMGRFRYLENISTLKTA